MKNTKLQCSYFFALVVVLLVIVASVWIDLFNKHQTTTTNMIRHHTQPLFGDFFVQSFQHHHKSFANSISGNSLNSRVRPRIAKSISLSTTNWHITTRVNMIPTTSPNADVLNRFRCTNYQYYDQHILKRSISTLPTSKSCLYYYNHYIHHRGMSKETEAKKQREAQEKYEKKYTEQGFKKEQERIKKQKEKAPYEWLPFWTTPERDPNESIYIQDPIAEKDCRPLRLFIPAAEDMIEIGIMCAMLFMTTPDLDTYESMPNNGDVIFLKGDVGSGKSTFARGFVRGAVGNYQLDVPSPTYLLSNTYFASADIGSNKNLEIHHMDLYRLQDHSNQQYFMLNLDHVFKNCLSLIEWPERLPEKSVPEERLELSIEYASKANADGTIDMESTEQYRILTFTPYGILWRRRVYDIRNMGYIEDLKMRESDEFNPNIPQN